jgi:hypothetical protein
VFPESTGLPAQNGYDTHCVSGHCCFLPAGLIQWARW